AYARELTVATECDGPQRPARVKYRPTFLAAQVGDMHSVVLSGAKNLATIRSEGHLSNRVSELPRLSDGVARPGVPGLEGGSARRLPEGNRMHSFPVGAKGQSVNQPSRIHRRRNWLDSRSIPNADTVVGGGCQNALAVAAKLGRLDRRIARQRIPDA